MALKLITAPTTYPVTLDEAKSQARVDIADDDTLIEAMIKAATEKAEQWTGRALMTQTWRLTLDEFPEACELTRIPIQSISSVKYFDTAGAEITMTTGQYYLDNADDFRSSYVLPAISTTWPQTQIQANACSVEFVAGYANAAAVPHGIKQWILMAVAAMYEYREAYTERELKLGFADTFLDRFKVY